MLIHLENEAELVAQAQAGVEDAFARLYNQYSRHVYRLAFNLTHDRTDAEDVLQDTFLKAFLHLREFRKESRLSTWLTRIAVNEALGRLRRGAGRKQVSLDEPIEIEGKQSMPREIEDRQADAEEVYSRLELQAVLSKAIGELEPASRMIVVLRYAQDVSTEATAKLLGLSVPAVKTRLLRARSKMRKSLSGFVGQGSSLTAR
ncbi:MAG TPA: sigma-70 family RNA polymerase sigma factor [Terriglobia bacterium]|jgi:RNA polymerase sigma-70 factor (ECF subfamily)|nr:sigma-70 family RNA polymerase sigma factor [Terriglobia bacterium]